MTQSEVQSQALNNALTNTSMRNYPDIFEGFLAMGIPESDILPRENIFTFHAWKAKDRQVKKGEHGVKIITYVPMTKTDDEGEKHTFRRPRATTVFHVSQTEGLNHV